MNKTSQKQESITTRRDFIKTLWKIAGIAAIFEFTYVGFSIFNPRKKTQISETSLFNAGNIDSFKNGTLTQFRANKFFLYRHADGGFIAFSVKCTHLGCSINWVAERNQFICPCHSSHFDIMGNVLSSPAPRPLDSFPVIISNNNILINTAKSVKRSKFSTNQLTYAQ